MSRMVLIPVLPENNMLNYERALEGAGLSYRKTDQFDEKNARECDGLLLPGGVDVSPALYGGRQELSLGVNQKLDDLQLRYLDAFVKAGKPVLGICRGQQMINVFFGGTLIQDLNTGVRHVKNGKEDSWHEDESRQGSWLNELYGSSLLVNSAHHQAVDQPGKGLMIDLYSKQDHVIEGMHHETLPVWCVQWHPERCSSEKKSGAAEGRKVFAFFASRLEKS